jgi:undecaprenyl diphosphate synthase
LKKESDDYFFCVLKGELALMLGRPDGDRLPEEKELLAQIDHARLPRHIAIIMDGNGRWAQRRGLPRIYGHRAGAESLREIVKLCVELEIKSLTAYAFSTENWKRPQKEVNTLMDLIVEYFHKNIDDLCANDIKINPIGRLQDLPYAAQKVALAAKERSRDNKGLILNLALSYGSRSELVGAVQAIAEKVVKGELALQDIDENTVGAHLYTAGQADPDLLIRHAGDFRISNFLLWQMAYTEFWLTPVLWPDFRRVHLLKAIVDFQGRERRFGGLR